MLNLIAGATHRIQLLIAKQSIKNIVSIFLVGILMMTTNVDSSVSDRKLGKAVDKVIHQDNEKRPKTTGEWNKQAREVQGKPGKLLKRVGEQSTEAIKDFGSVYPDTAKRSAAELKSSSD
jgi:hypothetical protein